jgi:hypothetical protein
MLLRGETLVDDSLNQYPLTVVGSAAVSTTQKKYGDASLRISASNSGFRLNTSQNQTPFNLGTGDWCIDWWQYYTAQTWEGVMMSMATSGGSGRFWVQGCNSSRAVKVLNDNATGGAFPGSNSNLVTLNTWQHIAMTHSGQVVRIFLNGVQQTSGNFPYTQSTWATGAVSAGSYPVVIGNTNDFPTTGTIWGSEAYFDHIRVTKGNVRYSGTFTPPTETDY